MNILSAILFSAACVCSVSMSYSAPEAEPEDPAANGESAGRQGGIVAKRNTYVPEPWLAELHGKTLSSLGQIVSVHIHRDKNMWKPSIQWTHRDVWDIIEHTVMMDLMKIGTALGIPPEFTVTYADGTKIRCDRNSAMITLPDGRSGGVALVQQARKDP